jgi:hypothetical protein
MSAALTAAYNSTQSTTTGSEDYQNGWKDCHHHILNLWSVFDAYLNSLSPAQKEACVALLSYDVVTLVYSDNKVQLVVPCSDTFGYACADQEYIEPESLPVIDSMYTKWGNAGVIAWLADYRATNPLPCLQRDKYKQALEWLHDEALPPF